MNRTHFEISMEILGVISSSHPKISDISRVCNVSFNLARYHLRKFSEKKMICAGGQDENGRDLYFLTGKGIDFYKKMCEFEDFIKEIGIRI